MKDVIQGLRLPCNLLSLVGLVGLSLRLRRLPECFPSTSVHAGSFVAQRLSPSRRAQVQVRRALDPLQQLQSRWTHGLSILHQVGGTQEAHSLRLGLGLCVCVCVSHPGQRVLHHHSSHSTQAGGRSRCKGLRLTKLPCIWEARSDQPGVPAFENLSTAKAVSFFVVQ